MKMAQSEKSQNANESQINTMKLAKKELEIKINSISILSTKGEDFL